MNKVASGEPCPVCGTDMDLFTEADQRDRKAHESWCAHDGDKVECPECGFRAWVSIDDQIAYINWDETDEFNVGVAEGYESRQSGASSTKT